MIVYAGEILAGIIAVYKDSQFKQSLDKIESEEIIQAGGKWEVNLYLLNISGVELSNIRLWTDDPDVKLSPSLISYLAPNQSIEVKFVWSPKTTRETPLSTSIFGDIYVIKRVK